MVKWVCTVGSALIVVAWPVSPWWYFGWERYTPLRNDWVCVGGGALRVAWQPLSAPLTIPISHTGFRHGLLIREARGLWGWKPEWGKPGATVYASVPLWMPFAAMVLPAGALWRRDIREARRARGGCASCGYDRRGLAADAKCPECGTVPKAG